MLKFVYSSNLYKKPDARVECEVDSEINPQEVDASGVRWENAQTPFLWK